MAFDEALLESVGKGASPVLRLYRWRPAALSLGYFQPLREVAASACRAEGVDLVRRPTGGRAVLHDREATYALIAPTEGVFAGGLLDSFRAIALALRQALALLGLPTELAPGRRRTALPADGNCFTSPSSWELVHAGCKVAGSSQKRAAAAFLQHGSIPLDIDLERLVRLLEPSAGEQAAERARQLRESVGWLNRWCDPPVGVEEAEEALIASFAAELGVVFDLQEPTPAECSRARQLVETKYGNREWTLERQF